MINPGNYTRIKVKLVNCQNEDQRVINKKCMSQNGKRVISLIANETDKKD